MIDLILAATIYATKMHDGQVREIPGGTEPYILHPLRVATILCRHHASVSVIAAAILHDVVEDTPATYSSLRLAIADTTSTVIIDRVVTLVDEVTNPARPEDGNRAARAQINLRHIAKTSYDGANIKLADMIDNLPSIIKNKPSFALVYVPEKAAQLAVLGHGHQPLQDEVREILDQYGAAQRLAKEVTARPAHEERGWQPK